MKPHLMSAVKIKASEVQSPSKEQVIKCKYKHLGELF